MQKVFWTQGAKVSQESSAPPKASFFGQSSESQEKLSLSTCVLLEGDLIWDFAEVAFSTYFVGVLK